MERRDGERNFVLRIEIYHSIISLFHILGLKFSDNKRSEFGRKLQDFERKMMIIRSRKRVIQSETKAGKKIIESLKKDCCKKGKKQEQKARIKGKNFTIVFVTHLGLVFFSSVYFFPSSANKRMKLGTFRVSADSKKTNSKKKTVN